MTVLVDSSTKVLVQGITGGEGSFHAGQMLEYGTQVVAGVTPGKGGQRFEDKVPVYDTVSGAVAATGADASAPLRGGRHHGGRRRWPRARRLHHRRDPHGRYGESA